MYMTIRQKQLESVPRYRGMAYYCPSIAVEATAFYYYVSKCELCTSDLTTFQQGLVWGSALWRRRRPIALA